jgi:Na+:H+ antiporter, NhaC family
LILKTPRLPSIGEIMIVLLLFLAVVVSFALIFELPIQLALFISWFIVIALGIRLGYKYDFLQKAITKGIGNGLEAILILLAVGALIGTWISGGIVPSLIYYGLEFINPTFFLLATLVICSITSVATGTSWGTVGTAGIAMMAIGEGMGMPLPLVAGAVISGAYFGDKLSPLSDSTILSASMAKVDVIAHVRAMLYLDIPAYIVTSILFTIAGFMYGGNNFDSERVEFLKSSLHDVFQINVWMLVPMVVVIVLLALKKPSLPSIAVGSLLGVVWGVLFQDLSVSTAFHTAYSGFSIESDITFITELLNRGGIESMVGSIIVIIFGLGFGGLLEELGVLKVLLSKFEQFLINAGNVTTATIFTGLLGNIFGCAMYVSLILTPKIMQDSYDRLKINRLVLARNSEVGGTLTSGMVPWTDNGIFLATILGVSTFAYLPFMWLSFVSIIIAIIYGYTGKFIWYTTDENKNVS